MDTAAPRPTRICIIGGGFSGAVVAVQLARHLADAATIEIIEPREMLGGGVAYSATDPSHRINVPAAKMVVFGEDPLHFARWLEEHHALDGDPSALWESGAAFPQRAVFGRYLAGLVDEARTARPDVTIRHRRTVAASIHPEPGGFAVGLADGETLPADTVVLAVSHPPPAVPSVLLPAFAAGAPIIADPWSPGALDNIPAGAKVLVVGTGLTMADAIATLDRRHHRGPILAISRRGLLSRGHPAGDFPVWSYFASAYLPATALGLSRAVREQVALANSQGSPWQVVFDDIRANAGRIWSALPMREKRRLIRHLRPFWDVHRFRVSPQAQGSVARLQQSGQLKVVAAALIGASWDGKRLSVELRQRGSVTETQEFQAVINTTGPAHGAIVATNPVLASLAAQGLLRADGTGLGLDVDGDNHPVGTNDVASPGLFVAGPLARGRVGELMGLPQVSQHAEAVARSVVLHLVQVSSSNS